MYYLIVETISRQVFRDEGLYEKFEDVLERVSTSYVSDNRYPWKMTGYLPN